MKRVFVLILVGFALALTALMYACVPASQRLASPVVCPSGTTDSVVVAYSTRNGSSSNFHTELHCIDPEGGGYEPSGVKIFFTLFGYVAIFVGLSYGARRLLRSRKVTA